MPEGKFFTFDDTEARSERGIRKSGRPGAMPSMGGNAAGPVIEGVTASPSRSFSVPVYSPLSPLSCSIFSARSRKNRDSWI